MKYILLLSVGIIWGSQYLLNTLILEQLSPVGLTALRMFIGFVTLTVIILILPSQRRRDFPLDKSLFKLLLFVGFTEAALPFTLISYAQLSVDSSLAALIMGSIPLFTLLLHTYVAKKHTITSKEIIGIIVSFIGLALLLVPSINSYDSSFLAYLAIFTAAFSFAYSFLLMEKIPKTLSPLQASQFILGFYSALFLAYWFFIEDATLPTTPQIWFYLFILGSLASGIVYLLYISLIRLAGPTFASLSNYIVPLIGVGLGILFLQESFTLEIAIALILIFVGLVITNV